SPPASVPSSILKASCEGVFSNSPLSLVRHPHSKPMYVTRSCSMSSAEHLSELEFLRSQVAELSRALAEREQFIRANSHHVKEPMQDPREPLQLLRTIIGGTAAETGDDFFASLVAHLPSTL